MTAPSTARTVCTAHPNVEPVGLGSLLATIVALTALAMTMILVAPTAGAQDAGDQNAAATTAGPEIHPGYLEVRGLLSEKRRERRDASKALIERGDVSLAFGIVDALFFIPKRLRTEALETLEALTGQEPGDSYWPWVEAVGELGETTRPAPGYMQWKTVLFSKIDPRYRQIFYTGAPAHIRLEEVVTGGVQVDGIPSLDDPTMVPAAEARYLRDDEAVFGVRLGGEARAYPLRILDWHEMLNDTVGGEPVTLSYCTLCGSGVLFKTRTPNGGAYRFGTSGLLYRSNKLMYDRASLTLWSNLTGEPVVGRLARGDRSLEVLPLNRLSWGEWKKRYPETLVVEIDDELKRVASKHGFDYRPGRADQARRGVSFPVWKRSQDLPQDAEIFVVRLGDAVKAYPLDQLFDHPSGVVNDEIDGRPVVVLAHAESGSVRAFHRAGTFAKVDGNHLVADGSGADDGAGARWSITEDSISAPDGGTQLDRIAGHHAFWFGWYAFFPQTEIWRGP
ncbi:MAG: DUF3179 domain-containing protein [Acidobacteriota bacterium]